MLAPRTEVDPETFIVIINNKKRAVQFIILTD